MKKGRKEYQWKKGWREISDIKKGSMWRKQRNENAQKKEKRVHKGKEENGGRKVDMAARRKEERKEEGQI